MCAFDPRERDLVKCEDMRIHAERARKFLSTYTFATQAGLVVVADLSVPVNF